MKICELDWRARDFSSNVLNTVKLPKYLEERLTLHHPLIDPYVTSQTTTEAIVAKKCRAVVESWTSSAKDHFFQGCNTSLKIVDENNEGRYATTSIFYSGHIEKFHAVKEQTEEQ